jgi:chloramphenicol O-acetyltransferase type A
MSHKHTPEAPGDEIDILSWRRKDTFEFFRSYADPFFQLTAPVNVTQLLQRSGKEGRSFFLSYLYLALKALNEQESFRQRFLGSGVKQFNYVHAGCTVLREDETFAFAFMPWNPDHDAFFQEGAQRLQQARFSDVLEPLDERKDVVFFSVIPWVSFTSFKNPHRDPQSDDIPRVVFGKTHQIGNEIYLPVSVEVHHALADGLHAGRFFERFEQLSKE